MCIIFSTCWYHLENKSSIEQFQSWIHNMLSNVNNYYLVVYTNEESQHFVRHYATQNPNRILIVIKPIEEFYVYRYVEYWIYNHSQNYILNHRIDWRVQMLWAEKIFFVWDTIQNGYFCEHFVEKPIMYGWCDIGYFRCRSDDTYGTDNDSPIETLTMWPRENVIFSLNPNKIHYGCVNNNTRYIKELIHLINQRGENGLPIIPIPHNQVSISGGFFMLSKENCDWYKNLFDETLLKYFENDCLVKDDQIIVADCVFRNMGKFILYKEYSETYDKWFMFQRLL